MKHVLFLFVGVCIVTMGAFAQSQSAVYSVTFEAVWSEETHPDMFPPNPHFSGLIGAVHSDQVRFWEPGGDSTPGMETMAESGGKSPLSTEVNEAVQAGTALSLLSGGGIGTSPGEATISLFETTLDHPLVTLVSMIAPSPDWFVGVDSLSLLDDGDWVPERVVELQAWDAGTDSGPNYTSANADTNPPEPIRILLEAPFAVGDEFPPLGTFTFQRVDQPSGVGDWHLYN